MNTSGAGPPGVGPCFDPGSGPDLVRVLLMYLVLSMYLVLVLVLVLLIYLQPILVLVLLLYPVLFLPVHIKPAAQKVLVSSESWVKS